MLCLEASAAVPATHDLLSNNFDNNSVPCVCGVQVFVGTAQGRTQGPRGPGADPGAQGRIQGPRGGSRGPGCPTLSNTLELQYIPSKQALIRLVTCPNGWTPVVGGSCRIVPCENGAPFATVVHTGGRDQRSSNHAQSEQHTIEINSECFLTIFEGPTPNGKPSGKMTQNSSKVDKTEPLVSRFLIRNRINLNRVFFRPH